MWSPLCSVAVEGTEGRSRFQRPRGVARVCLSACGYVRVPLASGSMSPSPVPRTIDGEPADHGIDATALAELVSRARREIDEGRLPSCQLAFARDGKLAVWITLGAAAPDSRYVIF